MSLLSKVTRCMKTIAPLELAESSWDNVGVLVGKSCFLFFSPLVYSHWHLQSLLFHRQSKTRSCWRLTSHLKCSMKHCLMPRLAPLCLTILPSLAPWNAWRLQMSNRILCWRPLRVAWAFIHLIQPVIIAPTEVTWDRRTLPMKSITHTHIHKSTTGWPVD